jgi:hypothetical protein
VSLSVPSGITPRRRDRPLLKSSVTMNWRNLPLLVLFPLALTGQTAQNPLPASDLKDPDGQKVQFKFRTLPNSVQVYTCRQTDQGFTWSGPDPDAIMTNSEQTQIVHHYKGPTWEATDGSVVRSDGRLAKHFLADRQNAVHWLELPAKEPTKQFGKVTFIHRIDTSGGLPPDKACDAQHAGDQERVNYSATYLFYAPK